MGQSPSSHFMAIGRIFDKALPLSISGFLEQGIKLVSEFLSICRVQRQGVLWPG